MKKLKASPEIAFTLIELLVVLAIIAVLVSLLAPVFAQARAGAYGLRCQMNLRAIGQATLLYCQDFDERFASPYSGEGGMLPDLHLPYLKDYRVWICPMDRRAAYWDGIWNSASFYVRSSYLSNAYIFQGSASDLSSAIGQAEINYASLTPLWTDGFASPGWATDAVPLSDTDKNFAVYHSAYGDNRNSSPTDPSGFACSNRQSNPTLEQAHNLGGNYSFADGHCRWHYPAQFTTVSLMTSHGKLIDDRTDPFVTNGARSYFAASHCLVFCCPGPFGTPPNDGEHPWFRP